MIGDRLKEERQRLRLNQSDFAGLAGAAKRTQIDWEKGNSSPTAEQLEAFAKAGVDVRYVVTGDRDGPITEALSAEERVLLDGFRGMDRATQKRMLAFVLGDGESKAGNATITHGDVGSRIKGDVTIGTLTVGGSKKK